MRKVIVLIGLSLLGVSVFAKTDTLLNELDKTLGNREFYTQAKLSRIKALENNIASNKSNPAKLYNNYTSIFNEYKTLNADSAFYYANKVEEQALKLNDAAKINISKINVSFSLLSSGLFKEAFEEMGSINTSKLNDDEKVEFFILKSTAYYDLGGFVNNKFYAEKYKASGNQMADSAIALSPAASYNHQFILGLKNLQAGNIAQAIPEYEGLISRVDSKTHDYAILAASLSYLFTLNHQQSKSFGLLVKSAIADIKSSTKENFSMFKLADTLFKAGDNERAYRYIQIALADAQYYGTKYRLSAIGQLLPIIEEKHLSIINKQKNDAYIYAATVTILILLIIAFSLIIVKQLKSLRAARGSLSDANETLEQANSALREANKIKDEYIGYNFNINSDYIDKIERFKKSVSQKLALGQYEEINKAIQKIDLKKERENLSQSFDLVFIKLFPNFVQEFNSLFEKEDQIKPGDGELLNTELRIFALIRLGIHDNDKIAKILDYSVNTIYSYKTKIKNKSKVANDEFEDKIMAIKAD